MFFLGLCQETNFKQYTQAHAEYARCRKDMSCTHVIIQHSQCPCIYGPLAEEGPWLHSAEDHGASCDIGSQRGPAKDLRLGEGKAGVKAKEQKTTGASCVGISPLSGLRSFVAARVSSLS